MTGDELAISHLEFVTVDGLVQLIDDLTGDEDKLNRAFPVRHAIEILYGNDA